MGLRSTISEVTKWKKGKSKVPNPEATIKNVAPGQYTLVFTMYQLMNRAKFIIVSKDKGIPVSGETIVEIR